jgi:hypothetical protein
MLTLWLASAAGRPLAPRTTMGTSYRPSPFTNQQTVPITDPTGSRPRRSRRYLWGVAIGLALIAAGWCWLFR